MNTEHITALWQSGDLTEAVYHATVMTPPGFDLAAFIEQCERDLRATTHDVADMKARSRCIDLMRESLTSAENTALLQRIDRATRATVVPIDVLARCFSLTGTSTPTL